MFLVATILFLLEEPSLLCYGSKQTKMGLEKVDSKGYLTTFKAGQDVSLKPKYCPSLKELDLKKPNPA
jgi:hypothetical protein